MVESCHTPPSHWFAPLVVTIGADTRCTFGARDVGHRITSNSICVAICNATERVHAGAGFTCKFSRETVGLSGCVW